MRFKALSCASIVWMNLAFAATSPLPMVEAMNADVLGHLRAHQTELKQHPEIVQNTIRSYLIPHVDTQGMSRSVLGREVWKQASSEQKQAFTREFTNLVLRTYARPLSDFNGETVKFVPFKPSNTEKFAQVQSIILRPNGQRIPMIYHVVWVNESWKIYDLSIEGVSLLASFKHQFGDALKQKSLSTVIQALHDKNQNLKS